ncbi:MAG TPA: serine hydrolase domain-containing protein [Gemmatimonadaceae bacterium]|jgi:CubicO group peptidase (beta-lactamase class C family)
MHRSLIVLTLTIASAIPLAAQSAPDFSEVRRILKEGMAREAAPAAAFAVVRDGKIIWEEAIGWADSVNNRRATPDSPFLLASLNKTFETTLAAVLQNRHVLDLGRPANEYLRTTAISSPVWDAGHVTVRQLYQHVAGLSTFNIGCDAGRPREQCHMPNADDMIKEYGIVVAKPGARFDYSNLGFIVASEAVARAAQKPLRSLIRDEVLVPLGMKHSSLGLDSAMAREAVVPFVYGRGLVPPTPTPDSSSDYLSFSGWASAHDLALFAAFHMKAHRPDQRTILADGAIDSMQTVTVATGSGAQRYGLGWWIEDRFDYRTVLSQGGNSGAQAWLRMVPSEHVAAVVLVNKGVGFAGAATDAALAAVLPKYADAMAVSAAQAAAPTSATPAAPPKPLDSTMVGDWVGVVQTAGGDVSLEFTVAPSGAVRAHIGTRADSGVARASSVTPGRFLLRFSGDLEAANPAGMNRETRLYLDRRGTGFGGLITTRPPAETGLDGSVSYWVEITRRP